MKKKTFVLHASIAVALCATTFATPAAADEGPTAPPTTRPGIAPFLPPAFAPLDAFIEYAKAIVTTQKAANDPVAPTAASPSAPAIPITAPARAAPQARSYPRTFATYDALVDYATSIATTQQAASDRLAAVLAQEDANRAALATVFDPRVRGGLMQSATELMDDVTIRALQAQLASDVSAARELVADGAVVTPPAFLSAPGTVEGSPLSSSPPPSAARSCFISRAAAAMDRRRCVIPGTNSSSGTPTFCSVILVALRSISALPSSRPGSIPTSSSTSFPAAAGCFPSIMAARYDF